MPISAILELWAPDRVFAYMFMDVSGLSYLALFRVPAENGGKCTSVKCERSFAPMVWYHNGLVMISAPLSLMFGNILDSLV